MGQPDLSSNSLIAYPDVFADIINAFVYEGRQVLTKEHLNPHYTNASTAKEGGKLKGLYRDTCMEDLRDGVRYVIWGIENQYADDYTIPFKVMGYDYTAYDRQIGEFTAQNKAKKTNAYVNGLLPAQKLKPVITIVLYYGTKEIPDSICAMMDIPEDNAIQKYIQNYKLNLIKLRELTNVQINTFRSDFAYIAKFLTKLYNKEELKDDLIHNKQPLIHSKDTLYTLAAITNDKRFLRLIETKKEVTVMCEIIDDFYEDGLKEGIERGRADGIKYTIECCKELGVKREDAFEKVVEKYCLTTQEASEYMDKYWI